MKQIPGDRESLDVPLVWDSRQGSPVAAGKGGGPGRSWMWRWRLLPAFLADLGIVLLSLGCAWVVAWWQGAALAAPQLVLGGFAGALVATVLGAGTLWGWRATPGMVLSNLAFTSPLALSAAVRLWLLWLVALPVLGLPLLVGGARGSVAERLAGSQLSFRSRSESA